VGAASIPSFVAFVIRLMRLVSAVRKIKTAIIATAGHFKISMICIILFKTSDLLRDGVA